MRLFARPLAALLLLLATPAWSEPPPEIAADALVEGPESLRYSDLERGEGDPLQAGAQVAITVRLWNTPDDPPVEIGTADAPLTVVVGAGTLIRGLDIGLVGMRRGGIRFLDIPASLTSGAGTPMKAVVAVLDGDGSTSGSPNRSTSTAGTGSTNRSAPAPVTGRVPPDSPPEVSDWDQKKNGLQIADLVEGDGRGLERGDRVVVEYTGWVAESGERFDSSLARAEAFRFQLGAGQVILGWDKGLRGMKVGGTRVLRIPAYLGYGASGAGSIPPHADLLFQVELLDIE